MTRADTYRPSIINPTEYDYVAIKYVGSAEDPMYDWEELRWNAREINAHMAKTGGELSDHKNEYHCHVCGAAARYYGVFWNRNTNVYIQTGLDCANKMSMGNPHTFESFRKRVAEKRELMGKDKKAKAYLEERGLGAAWPINRDPNKRSRSEGTISDMVFALIKYGSMSDKQTAFMAKLLAELPTQQARFAALRAQDELSQYVGTVGKREVFKATVAFAKTIETQYGMMNIINLRAGDNIMVYMGNSMSNVTRGDVVEFKATVKKHDTYKGIRQTAVSRPVIISAAPIDTAQ